ncbi:MAG TPA: helix-turn-helix transcriptional regulator, partial [Chitinophagaceae bacterium]|nr:helix-turn-helix transcriptional regulator [Chitinophagaceae bacterium]
EYYILIFDDIRQRDGYTVSIGEETAQPTNRNAALYLTSFLFDMEQMLSKGVTIKGMRARLSAGWLKKFLRLSEKRDVLEEYINLKTAGMWFKPVDPAVREPFGELFLPEQAPLLFYQNRVLQIVEAFFSWLYDRSRMLAGQKGLSREDIKSAERIESILTGEETVIPPTIPELAREAMMSESKLKKIFKAVYGMPPYEYFQKHRMQKARTLLLSGKYSIKDVGYTLGYNNLSNFTLAFKKEFGQLPSELLRSVR